MTRLEEPRRKPRVIVWGPLGVVALLAALASPLLLTSAQGSPAVTAGSITASVQDRLKDQGVTVRALTESAAAPVDSAVGLARAELSSVARDAPAVVALVLFTDSVRGTDLGEGKVAPTYSDRKAWAIVFSGVSLPLIGAPEEVKMTEVAGTLVVFIDANTDEYLEAFGLSN